MGFAYGVRFTLTAKEMSKILDIVLISYIKLLVQGRHVSSDEIN